MTVGTIEQKHGDLGRVSIIPAHEATSKHKKKPDDSPYALCEGPAKKPAPETTEKRPARHEDTIFLCWHFFSGAKEHIELGRFTHNFAEITDEMSPGAESAEY